MHGTAGMRAGSWLVVVGLVAFVILGGACSDSKNPASEGKVNVVTSFYPLYEAAKRVGGAELAAVQNLVPAGAEPHDFDPTPRDIIKLEQADIVVYNGAGFEPWLERLLPDLEKKGNIILVAGSRNLELLEMEDEGDPSQRVPDPHVWLDPVLMEQIVAAVRDAYIRTDPGNRSTYEANAASYIAEMEALHREYQSGLAAFSGRAFVTSHAAFAYLANRYQLEMIPIAGLTPEAEPSPQDLVAIVKTVKERGIRYIFFETLVSPRLAQTIAQEVGAQTLVLNPLEGITDEEAAAGKGYVSVMRENLENLKTALGATR